MSQITKVERALRKNKKLAAFVAIAILLLMASPQILQSLNIAVPGPEGLVVYLAAAEANGQGQIGDFRMRTPITNAGVKSYVGDARPNDWIAYVGTDIKTGYRWKVPSGTTATINLESEALLKGLSLNVRTSRPTQNQLDISGNPIDPNAAPRQINWYAYNKNFQTAGDERTWTHYEAYVVPVDFIIELSVRPTGDNTGGYFNELTLWFVIDTNVWYNAFTQSQLEMLQEMPPNVVQTGYNFRGGFPIWAWIGAWDPFVLTGNSETALQREFELFGKDGNTNKKYDIYDDIPYSELSNYLMVNPSFGGSEVRLYHTPDWQYDPMYSADVLRNEEVLGQMIEGSIGGLPDARFATTVYTPITLEKYGALHKKEGTWWLGTERNTYYYPTSYMRVRVLYAIYGEWTYLWSEQEAEEMGYEWENRTSQIVHQESLWDSLLNPIADWFSSPLNQLWMILILIGAALVVVTIFFPSFWALVFGWLRTRKTGKGG